MMAEKGFTNAEVTHKVTPVAGGPKLVNVTFNVSEGPKIKIRDVDFVGNTAMSDGTLQKKMKENKPKGLLGFITGGGTYKEAKFEEDADKIVEFYQNEGYVRARVGQPELKVLEDSKDGKERWVQLRIPVTEGPRYRIGEFDVRGQHGRQDRGAEAALQVKPGEWYSVKKIRDGLRKAQEIYGSGGYMEFTGFPDLKPSDDGSRAGSAGARAPRRGRDRRRHQRRRAERPDRRRHDAFTEGQAVLRQPHHLHRQHDDARQRHPPRDAPGRGRRLRHRGAEVQRPPPESARLLQADQRQDQRAMKVDKTPGRDEHRRRHAELEEQNRNQLTFGAGVSQYEGFFGQLAFQTSNFLGRGESLTVSMQAGDRAQNYQLAFTEPFLFDRNITGGFDVYKRSLQYIGYYTQKSTGGNLVFGFPVANFSRMFVNYSYEPVKMTDLNEALLDQSCI